jgi:hypothetical protein
LRVAVVGGNNYGCFSAVRVLVQSLPAATTLVLTSNLGVCRICESEASARHLLTTTVLWKCRAIRILPYADAFVVFFDGTNSVVIPLIKLILDSGKPLRVFGPMGTEIRLSPGTDLRNSLASPAKSCINVSEVPDTDVTNRRHPAEV